METLRLGSKGPLVERWKNFLRGLNLFHGEVNDEFDEATKDATEQFQTLYRLGVDGVAGNETIGRAMVNGFELVNDASGDRNSPNWPPAPLDLAPMSQASRQTLFGSFAFKPAPTPDNPEGILITDDWPQRNIVMVEIPQLKGVKGAPSNCKIAWHVKGVDQIQTLFKVWEEEGLLNRILTWAGSWNPRFVRGSRTNLSNHAFGSAFDINAAWNGLGARPALIGQTGCVRELVDAAAANGFFWGGWFGRAGAVGGRSDGMHFELMRSASV